jgi:hypothetical protein
MFMAAGRRGRRPTVDKIVVQARAHDVYILLRSLPNEEKAAFLDAGPSDLARLYPPGSWMARKFPNDEFPTDLVEKAKKHPDYPRYDVDGQLRFVARYISGGNAKPEYALKITQNSLPDKNPTRF